MGGKFDRVDQLQRRAAVGALAGQGEDLAAVFLAVFAGKDDAAIPAIGVDFQVIPFVVMAGGCAGWTLGDDDSGMETFDEEEALSQEGHKSELG
jgi:hypothetical protein